MSTLYPLLCSQPLTHNADFSLLLGHGRVLYVVLIIIVTGLTSCGLMTEFTSCVLQCNYKDTH